MEYEQIRYTVADAVATLTLNRPERLNAYTERMGLELRHAFAAAENDPEVVVIVLTGAGRGFCAGADMSVLDGISKGQTEVSGARSEELPGDPTMGPSFRGPFSYPMSVLKPVIGAINGPCVGLGFVVALGCDIRIASDRASFSTVFAKRGLVAEWGSSWMLPRLVGTAHALDLMLSARTVQADEAQQMGLVNRVVPHEQLEQVAREYALAMATQCSPASMAVIKRDVLQHLTSSLAQAEADSALHMGESFRRPDFREGLMAFAEKRAPKFPGLGKRNK